MKFLLKHLGNLSIFIGAILIVVPFVYVVASTYITESGESLVSASVKRQTEIVGKTPIKDNSFIDQGGGSQNSVDFDIPSDKAVDYGNKIKIPAIGVETSIFESGNSDIGLENGVWRMPGFGIPGVINDTVILAAHRWGPDSASWEFRRRNLFLNLPELKAGDKIELTFGGKSFNYEIIGLEEGNYVSQMPDLILITCKYLESDLRIFVYAKKI